MQFAKVFRKEQIFFYGHRCRLFFLCHFPKPPNFVLSLLNESVASHTVEILLPDIFVFITPAAHKVFTKKNIAAAGIAGGIMATIQVKQPY
jgi:hypothetical protein